jgi:S-adenosylmethionine hydrolase
MCGRQQKLSKKGEEYGWSSTVFCTPETFFGEDIFAQAARISEKEATEKITAQILRLNPKAEPKRIVKFING